MSHEFLGAIVHLVNGTKLAIEDETRVDDIKRAVQAGYESADFRQYENDDTYRVITIPVSQIAYVEENWKQVWS
jgi:hypothetical protein